jgi:hypothetical protein
MIGLAIISLLGALILVWGIRLLAQSRNWRQMPAVTIDDYANAREALDAVFAETASIKRIFAVEDAEFVARSATPDVQRLFLSERKKLAQQWFAKTRRQVAQLMDLHLRLASYTYDPTPGFELKLTVKYLTFVVVSNIAAVLLWLLGPFNATRIISYTIRTAGNVCTTFSLRLKQVNPTRLSSGPESLVH